MNNRQNRWTRDEMILTLALYFQLPFGRLNHTTPEVKELAKMMNRTENRVALGLMNFVFCDNLYTVALLFDNLCKSFFQRRHKKQPLIENPLFIA